MIYVKVKIIWIAVQRGISFYTWCLLLIFRAERKCLVRKLCSEEQHPPWSYPILFVLCCHWTMLIWRLCEWKYVIVNLLGRVYQAVKMMKLPGNKKPKENQKRKKKGKNIIVSGNVLWWTWTDFEALHKLLHQLVVMLCSVLVNSQCNLHHYQNIVLKDSHNYMYNITIITWPYIWINLTSLLDSDEDPFPPKATSVKKEESSKAKKNRRPISLDSGREMMCTYWGCPILFMWRVIERFYFHGNHDFNFFFWIYL